MKANRMTNCSIIDSVRRKTRPETAYRVTAGLAVIAWLALAGDAFAQSTNQWAPAPVAPVVQTATPMQVWAGANGANTPVFAPADLDLRLENATGGQAMSAPLATPVAPTTPPIQTPVYAPSSLTSTGQAPAGQGQSGPQYTAPAQQPYGTAYPAQGYGGYGYPFGNGFGGLPYGNGFGYPGGIGGYPYGNGFGTGYPGFGTGIFPGFGGWGTPYNSYNSYTGVPIFGGAPFGFW